METDVLRALMAQRPLIRANWEALLRLERPSSPLANPDLLVHLLDQSLDEIFRDFQLWSPRAHPRSYVPLCPCGMNPWLAYLRAGRQALRQALIEAQSALAGQTQEARTEALAALEQVLDHIARREIEAFCSVCQSRPKAQAPVPPAEFSRSHPS